jgi:hypothetical protein
MSIVFATWNPVPGKAAWAAASPLTVGHYGRSPPDPDIRREAGASHDFLSVLRSAILDGAAPSKARQNG